MGKATELIWQVHSWGPSEQNPVKNFVETGVCAYPGTAHIFGVLTVTSGTGKATDFRFCKHIDRVDWNKSL